MGLTLLVLQMTQGGSHRPSVCSAYPGRVRGDLARRDSDARAANGRPHSTHGLLCSLPPQSSSARRCAHMHTGTCTHMHTLLQIAHPDFWVGRTTLLEVTGPTIQNRWLSYLLGKQFWIHNSALLLRRWENQLSLWKCQRGVQNNEMLKQCCRRREKLIWDKLKYWISKMNWKKRKISIYPN